MTSRAAGVVLAVALIAAAIWAPHDALALWRYARNGHATPRAQRALGPALDVGILDPTAVQAAAKYLPRNATYYVAAGPNAPERTAAAIPYVLPWATFNLLPRRATNRPDQAEWILAYGANPRSLGVRVGRVIQLAPGVSLARVVQ